MHIQSQNRAWSNLFSDGGRGRAGHPAPYFHNPRISRRYTFKQLKETGVWYSNMQTALMICDHDGQWIITHDHPHIVRDLMKMGFIEENDKNVSDNIEYTIWMHPKVKT